MQLLFQVAILKIVIDSYPFFDQVTKRLFYTIISIVEIDLVFINNQIYTSLLVNVIGY